MYVEEIATKKKGKVYKTFLVRESFRIGSRVRHRTISNISCLPQGCIEHIKGYLQGKILKFDFSNIKILNSIEYGASKSFISLSKKLKFKEELLVKESRLRDLILTLVIGNLIYPGDVYSLINRYKDSVIWENCKYLSNSRPEAEKDISFALDLLLKQQSRIEKKLLVKQCDKYFLAHVIKSTVYEAAQYESKFYNNFITKIYTNLAACPVAIKQFDQVRQELFLKHEEIKDNVPQIFIGNEKKILQCATDIKFISPLKQKNKFNFLKTKELLPDNLILNQPFEIDSLDISFRYIFWKNKESKIENPNDFFSNLTIVKTNVEKDLMSPLDIFKAYQIHLFLKCKFQKVEISTDSELLDNKKLESYFFLNLLSFYFKWHIEKKITAVNKKWEFQEILERLKAIRIQDIEVGNSFSYRIKTAIDAEQEEILSILGVTLMAKLAKK